jgi:hypothetical protein
MSAQRPFDPVPLLAAFLHEEHCPGHPTPIDPIDCLTIRPVLDEYVARLRAAGLALVPTESVRLLEQLMDGLTETPDVEEVPVGEPNQSRSRAYAPTWVILRHRDGQLERGGPYQRWLAELLLCDLGTIHDADVVAARLEGEAPWIDELLRELGNAA